MYFFHSCLVSHCEHAWFTWIIGYKWGYCDSLPLTALLMMFCNPLKFNNSTLQIGCISIGLYPVVNSVNCEQKCGVHTRSNIHFLEWTLSDVTKGTNISHCYPHPHHHQGRLYSNSCMSPIPNMWKVQQTINFSRKLKLSICMCFEELKSLHNSLCKAAPLDSWRENKHVKINSKISNWVKCVIRGFLKSQLSAHLIHLPCSRG